MGIKPLAGREEDARAVEQAHGGAKREQGEGERPSPVCGGRGSGERDWFSPNGLGTPISHRASTIQAPPLETRLGPLDEWVRSVNLS